MIRSEIQKTFESLKSNAKWKKKNLAHLQIANCVTKIYELSEHLHAMNGCNVWNPESWLYPTTLRVNTLGFILICAFLQKDLHSVFGTSILSQRNSLRPKEFLFLLLYNSVAKSLLKLMAVKIIFCT